MFFAHITVVCAVNTANVHTNRHEGELESELGTYLIRLVSMCIHPYGDQHSSITLKSQASV